jgi:hypothetical protein
MKTITTINLLLMTALVVIFNACKKQDATNETGSSQTTFKSVIQKWQQTESSKTTFSAKRKPNVDSVLKSLDYTEAINIKLGDSATLYLIKISGQKKSVNTRYFALRETGNTLSLEGVYEAKDLQNIQHFYAANKIAGRDSILIWDLENRPVKGWETGSDGRLKERLAFWRSRTTASIQTNSTAAKSIKTYLYAAPQDGECIDWYWTIYDLYTHEIYSEVYIGSSGNCGGSFGNNDPVPEPAWCGQYTSDEIADMVAGATLADVNQVSYNNGTESTDENGRITKPATPTWRVMECRLGVTGKYFFTAYYSGVKFRTSENDPSWKWQSFAYSSFSGAWQNVACSIDITINSISHAEARKDDYVYDVSLSFSALVKTSVPSIPLSNSSNTVNAINKTFSFDAAY